MSGEHEYVRCFLQGDNSVGKTTLCITHKSKEFPARIPARVPTSYAGNHTVIEAYGGRRVTVTVVYSEIPTVSFPREEYWPKFYTRCEVCLMCFSLVDPRTYKNILKEYYAHFTTWRFDFPILVVGMKCDLVDDVDTLSRLRGEGEAPLRREDGVRLAETINAVGYVECSSLTGVGVDQVFREACKAGLDMKEPPSKDAR